MLSPGLGLSTAGLQPARASANRRRSPREMLARRRRRRVSETQETASIGILWRGQLPVVDDPGPGGMKKKTLENQGPKEQHSNGEIQTIQDRTVWQRCHKIPKHKRLRNSHQDIRNRFSVEPLPAAFLKD